MSKRRNMGLADLHIHTIYSYDGTTVARKGKEWNAVKILGSWLVKYAASALNHFSLAVQ